MQFIRFVPKLLNMWRKWPDTSFGAKNNATYRVLAISKPHSCIFGTYLKTRSDVTRDSKRAPEPKTGAGSSGKDEFWCTMLLSCVRVRSRSSTRPVFLRLGENARDMSVLPSGKCLRIIKFYEIRSVPLAIKNIVNFFIGWILVQDLLAKVRKCQISIHGYLSFTMEFYRFNFKPSIVEIFLQFFSFPFVPTYSRVILYYLIFSSRLYRNILIFSIPVNDTGSSKIAICIIQESEYITNICFHTYCQSMDILDEISYVMFNFSNFAVKVTECILKSIYFKKNRKEEKSILYPNLQALTLPWYQSLPLSQQSTSIYLLSLCRIF